MSKELSRIIRDTERWQRCTFSRAMAVTVILSALIVLAGSAFSQEIVRTVKAKEGDTVKKVADREKIDALKLAEYNGLLPDSVLGAGREILIPIWLSAPKIKVVSPPNEDPPSAGQSKMSTTSGKSPAVTWDDRPFGYSLIDKLPPRYHGHSYGDVLQSLSKVSRQLAKDEFETTEAYNQRLSKIRSQRLVGLLTHNDRLAFNFLPHQDGFHISYDADKQTLNFIIEWARNSNYDWVHPEIFFIDVVR